MKLPIKTDRLYITELNENMINSIYLSSLDEDNRRFVPDEVFETPENAREAVLQLISFYSCKDMPLVYAITLHNDEYIGHIQAVPIEQDWEIGYHIAKPFTGNGFATEAVKAFLLPIMNYLEISKLYGICHVENIASRMVLEKCGFISEYEGAGLYQGIEQMICRYIIQIKSNVINTKSSEKTVVM